MSTPPRLLSLDDDTLLEEESLTVTQQIETILLEDEVVEAPSILDAEVLTTPTTISHLPDVIPTVLLDDEVLLDEPPPIFIYEHPIEAKERLEQSTSDSNLYTAVSKHQGGVQLGTIPEDGGILYSSFYCLCSFIITTGTAGPLSKSHSASFVGIAESPTVARLQRGRSHTNDEKSKEAEAAVKANASDSTAQGTTETRRGSKDKGSDTPEKVKIKEKDKEKQRKLPTSPSVSKVDGKYSQSSSPSSTMRALDSEPSKNKFVTFFGKMSLSKERMGKLVDQSKEMHGYAMQFPFQRTNTCSH